MLPEYVEVVAVVEVVIGHDARLPLDSHGGKARRSEPGSGDGLPGSLAQVTPPAPGTSGFVADGTPSSRASHSLRSECSPVPAAAPLHFVTHADPSSPLMTTHTPLRLTVRRKGCPHCRVGRPAGDAASLLSDVTGRGRYMLREGRLRVPGRRRDTRPPASCRAVSHRSLATPARRRLCSRVWPQTAPPLPTSRTRRDALWCLWTWRCRAIGRSEPGRSLGGYVVHGCFGVRDFARSGVGDVDVILEADRSAGRQVVVQVAVATGHHLVVCVK